MVTQEYEAESRRGTAVAAIPEQANTPSALPLLGSGGLPSAPARRPQRSPHLLGNVRWWKLLLVTGSLGLAVALYGAAGARAAVVGSAPSPIVGEGAVTKETPLGNLVADAVRNAAKSEKVDAALVPAGSLTETALPEGQVSDEAIRKALAFPDDRVVAVKLTGEQIKKALERSVSLYPKKFLGYLQVSGITFSFKDGDVPEGSRVVNVRIAGVPLDLKKEYVVAMPEPLGVMGDHGYKAVWGKPQVVARLKTTLLDAVVDSVRTQQKLMAKVEDRIKVVKS
ncbi:MAG TPA: 5'-nucleotidase [Armatimonadota bacterium]